MREAEWQCALVEAGLQRLAARVVGLAGRQVHVPSHKVKLTGLAQNLQVDPRAL